MLLVDYTSLLVVYTSFVYGLQTLRPPRKTAGVYSDQAHAYSTAKYLQALLIMIIHSDFAGV